MLGYPVTRPMLPWNYVKFGSRRAFFRRTIFGDVLKECNRENSPKKNLLLYEREALVGTDCG